MELYPGFNVGDVYVYCYLDGVYTIATVIDS